MNFPTITRQSGISLHYHVHLVVKQISNKLVFFIGNLAEGTNVIGVYGSKPKSTNIHTYIQFHKSTNDKLEKLRGIRFQY